MRPTVIDLFAGPGGWDVAAADLGFRPVGFEHDASACATRAAAGHRTIRADVSQVPTAPMRGKVGGLIASPPCQTFSAAGNRDGIKDLGRIMAHARSCVTGWHPAPTFDDPRTGLVLEPLRFACELVPDWIALEQVPDVLAVWEAYAYTLRALGWSVWCGVLNSADFGVPQTRRRAILMAHRRREVSPPVPTHCRGGSDTLFGELLPWVSMAEALGWSEFDAVYQRGAGLTERHGGRPARECEAPAPTLTGSALGAGAGAGAKLKLVLRAGVQEHAAVRGIDEPAPTITASMDNGDTQWVVDRRTNSRGAGGTTVPTVTVPTNRPAPTLAQAEKWIFRRPATTVQGDPRCLTVEEALRLQSFPADYPVLGTKTKKFEQIGNAIPPGLARPILAALTEAEAAPRGTVPEMEQR